MNSADVLNRPLNQNFMYLPNCISLLACGYVEGKKVAIFEFHLYKNNIIFSKGDKSNLSENFTIKE